MAGEGGGAAGAADGAVCAMAGEGGPLALPVATAGAAA